VPRLIDLVAGQVQVMFGSMPSMIQYVRAGTLRPLGVTTPARSDVLPDCRQWRVVAGYEASDFYGLAARRTRHPKLSPG